MRIDVPGLLVAVGLPVGTFALAMAVSLAPEQRSEDVFTAQAATEAPAADPAGAIAQVSDTGSFTALGWVLVGVLAAAGLGFVVRSILKVVRGAFEAVRDLRHDRQQRKVAELPGELSELRARHHELSMLYGQYLTDPFEALSRPLLNDVSAPSTAEFVEAYAVLSSMGVSEVSKQRLARYRDAVSCAWRAWRGADSEATRVGTRNYAPEDQKRIRRAIDLLKLASDDGASEFERTSALTQANKLMEGLVVLPQEAVLTLEAGTRPALDA